MVLLLLGPFRLGAQSQGQGLPPIPKQSDTQPKVLLRRALEFARRIEGGPDRALVLINLAPLEATTGDMRSATDCLRLLTKKADRDVARAAIAIALARAGRPREALDIAHSVEDELNRGIALQSVALAQGQQGDVKAAIRTADEIDFDYRLKAETLRDIATSQRDAGNPSGAEPIFEAAISTLRSGKDEESVAAPGLNKTERIAEIEYEAGHIAAAQKDLDDAFDSIQAMQDINLRVDGLERLASIEVKVGNVARAQQVISEVPDNPNLGFQDSDISTFSVLLEIVRAQIASNELTSALDTARSISGSFSRISALTEITLAQARMGDTTGARKSLMSASESVEANSEEWLKAKPFDQIAAAYWKIGEPTMAEQFLDKAAVAARSAQPDWIKGSVLEEVGLARLGIDDFDGAIRTARDISSISERMRLFRSIGEKLVRSGDRARALRVFQEETTPAIKAEILMGMVDALLPGTPQNLGRS